MAITLNNLAAVATIATFGIAGVVFSVNLENRVKALEKTEKAAVTSHLSVKEQICLKLLSDYIEAEKADDYSTTLSLNPVIDRFQCEEKGKPAEAQSSDPSVVRVQPKAVVKP